MYRVQLSEHALIFFPHKICTQMSSLTYFKSAEIMLRLVGVIPTIWGT